MILTDRQELLGNEIRTGRRSLLLSDSSSTIRAVTIIIAFETCYEGCTYHSHHTTEAPTQNPTQKEAINARVL